MNKLFLKIIMGPSNLNALKFVEICLWDVRVEWITEVKFVRNKWIFEGWGYRKMKKMTKSTDASDVIMTRFGYRVDFYNPPQFKRDTIMGDL